MIAALLLAVLLATLTIRNIRREESLMRTFFTHEGLTLIRAFEAGARTTMMHRMQGVDPLGLLVEETAREPSLAYIRVVDKGGAVIAASGEWPPAPRSEIAAIMASAVPVTTIIRKKKIFEVASSFTPLPGGRGGYCGGGRLRRLDGRDMVIYLGLRTDEFDQARRVDIRHSLLLGSILFLAGSAGFYLLFLFQEVRVTRRTLTDMELYTENVIESMPAGLITLDARGRVVSGNRRVEAIIGRRIDALKGRAPAEVIPVCPAHLSGGELIEQPFTCIHDDGTAIPVRVSTSILHDRRGRVNGTVLIIRDVREVIEIERKLEESRRLSALGRMAAGIAHEIRNPLGTMRGFAQLFVRKFEGRPTEQEHARMMVDEVDRLDRTISSLLKFARPRDPEPEKVRLDCLVTETARFMSDDFITRGIDFHLDLPENEVSIMADPDLLRQVLLNLLHNALSATGRDGRIEAAVTARADGAVIRVSDSGCGMTSEERERMFDPFFTTRKDGTGLGLAVVHQIVSSHRGHIEVETVPGSGTTVRVLLPLLGAGAVDESAFDASGDEK